MVGALAGIGAATLLYAILSAVGIELWFAGVYVVASGPTRFEILLLPAFVLGGFVAFRFARWRGSLLLTAFAGVAIVRTLLAGWIVPNLVQMQRGLPGRPADLDFVTPQSWALLGIALGVLAAQVWRPRIRLRGALEAAGVYGIGMTVWAVVQLGWLQLLCASSAPDCSELVNVGRVLWSVVFGLLGGVLFARRTSGAGLIVLALLALPTIGVLLNQGNDIWRYSGPAEFAGTAANIVGVIAMLVGAQVRRSRVRSSGGLSLSPR